MNVQLKCLVPVHVRCSEKKKKRRDKETETIWERGTFLYLGRILIRQKLSNPVKAYQRLSFAITSNARKWGGHEFDTPVQNRIIASHWRESWFRENFEKKSQISPQMTKDTPVQNKILFPPHSVPASLALTTTCVFCDTFLSASENKKRPHNVK